MTFSEAFPIWDRLKPEEQQALESAAQKRYVKKDTVLHSGKEDCVGLFAICSGQLRAYIVSPEGKEITLYRLFERDMCLFSAACIMNSIQFDIMIGAEKDAALWMIPVEVYKRSMQTSAVLANYTNELMAARFSEVMWRLDQILFQRFDRRLASFLLEESAIDGSDTLETTHEKIANHLGSAREVVTRMLKYFQGEQMVELSRGTIRLTDRTKLALLAQ